jgi:glycerophosphoryl diester phosphodiesterase
MSVMSRRPLLLGHRGARYLSSLSENTLPSFDRALDDGCDGFEFDVRLTRDGRAVICHDPRYKGAEVAHADADQLRGLADLPAVLVRYGSRAFLDIELKVPGLDERTVAALEQYPPSCGYIVSSFLPEVFRALHRRSQTIPLGFICDRPESLDLWRNLPIQYVIPHYALVSRKLVEGVHAEKKQIFVWTVNSQSEILQLAEWAVDGIISDDTRLLAQTLAG